MVTAMMTSLSVRRLHQWEASSADWWAWFWPTSHSPVNIVKLRTVLECSQVRNTYISHFVKKILWRKIDCYFSNYDYDGKRLRLANVRSTGARVLHTKVMYSRTSNNDNGLWKVVLRNWGTNVTLSSRFCYICFCRITNGLATPSASPSHWMTSAGSLLEHQRTESVQGKMPPDTFSFCLAIRSWHQCCTSLCCAWPFHACIHVHYAYKRVCM